LVVRAQVVAKVVFVERFAPISLPPPSPRSREEEEVGEEATTVKVTIIIISFSTTRNRDNNNIDTESYGTIKFVHRRRLLQIMMLVKTTT
jgi:hypothetical protein